MPQQNYKVAIEMRTRQTLRIAKIKSYHCRYA